VSFKTRIVAIYLDMGSISVYRCSDTRFGHGKDMGHGPGKPYDWTTVAPGIGVAYRRSPHISAWVVRGPARSKTGKPGYWTKNLPGIPDDYEDSNGIPF
jgi:hypothetical protein